MSETDKLAQAKSLINTGQKKQAIPIIEELLRANPRDARAWGLLALAVEGPQHQRESLEKVIALTDDPQTAAWAKERLAQISASSAPVAPVPKGTREALPQSAGASDRKPNYMMIGGIALIVVLVAAVAMCGIALMWYYQSNGGRF